MPSQQQARKSTQPSNSGIVTDKTGDRFIPESQRADGSTRKAIKVRPGFRPTEDVELYRSRGTGSRGVPGGVPGAAAAADDTSELSVASAKNAKRREARKKAKEAVASSEGQDDGADGAMDGSGDGDKNNADTLTAQQTTQEQSQEQQQDQTVPEQVESTKKARALRKKLRQARELQSKKDDGKALLPEQIAKVIKINELVRELETLGLDEEEDNNKGNDKHGAGEGSAAEDKANEW